MRRSDGGVAAELPEFVLGSSSNSRAKVLREHNFLFTVSPPDIDEGAVERPSDLSKVSLYVARAKAKALSERLVGNSIVVCADTVLVKDDEVIEKPSNREEARKRLRSYSKSSCDVVTGLVVFDSLSRCFVEGIEVVTVYFAALSDATIDALVADGSCLHCAGALQIERPEMSKCIESMQGTQESVRGMPVALLRRLLSEVRQQDADS